MLEKEAPDSLSVMRDVSASGCDISDCHVSLKQTVIESSERARNNFACMCVKGCVLINFANIGM